MVNRIARVNELIKQEMGRILEENVESCGSLITVSYVKTSPDLRNAKVYVSAFPYEKKDIVMKNIADSLSRVQHILGERIALKYTPKVEILFDESYQYESDIEDLFKKIKNDRIGG